MLKTWNTNVTYITLKIKIKMWHIYIYIYIWKFGLLVIFNSNFTIFGFIIGTCDHNSFLFISSAINLFDFHRKKYRYFNLTILVNHNSLDLIVQKSLAYLLYLMLTLQYSGFIIGTSDHNSFLFLFLLNTTAFLFISSAVDIFI